MQKLPCDPSTLAGPVDHRALDYLENRFGKLESDYINLLEEYHGGVIENVSIKVDSEQYSVARFLTMIDRETELEGAFRPHFTASEVDERYLDGMIHLIGGEHNTARALFDVLLPFASTQVEMILERAYVDLFCFDFRNSNKPGIVLWLSTEASKTRMNWERLPIDQRYDIDDNVISVPWEEFIVPIAESFEEFLRMLEVKH